MKKFNTLNWILNILFLVFMGIFIIGFNSVMKIFEIYTSLDGTPLNFGESFLMIIFIASIFSIPAIIIIKVVLFIIKRKQNKSK